MEDLHRGRTDAAAVYRREEAVVENCYINQGCIVNGNVKNSVLFTNVEVGSGAQVVDSVIMPNAVIGEGAKVTRCIVADNVEISPGAVVGTRTANISN